MQHLVQDVSANTVRITCGDEHRAGIAGKEVRRQQRTACPVACGELANEKAHILIRIDAVEQVGIHPPEHDVDEARLRMAIAIHVDARRAALPDERDVVREVEGPQREYARPVAPAHDGGRTGDAPGREGRLHVVGLHLPTAAWDVEAQRRVVRTGRAHPVSRGRRRRGLDDAKARQQRRPGLDGRHDAAAHGKPIERVAP